MHIKPIQQFSHPFRVNCYVPHGGEWTSLFWGRVKICLTPEGRLELPVENIGFFLSVFFQNSVFPKWCDPKRVVLQWFDKWPKLLNFSTFIWNGIWGVVLKREIIGNVFPISISLYLLNMCPEPLIMVPHVRFIWLLSMKVEFLASFQK